MAILIKASCNLATAQTFVGKLPDKPYDFLFSLVGYEFLPTNNAEFLPIQANANADSANIEPIVTP